MPDRTLQIISIRGSHAISGVEKMEEFLFTVILENLLGRGLPIKSWHLKHHTNLTVINTYVYLEDQPKVSWWRIIAGEQRLRWEEWDMQESIAQCLFRVGSDTRGETCSCPLRGHPCRKVYAVSRSCTPKCHCPGSTQITILSCQECRDFRLQKLCAAILV